MTANERRMSNGQPSRTALAAAYARAYHQIAGDPRILTDPVVTRLLGLDSDEPPETGTEAPDLWVNDQRRRLFFAARARFAEDTIAAADAGMRQVAILGAGLDTFAFRNPHPGLHVFEVDHPATQAWKRDLLMRAGIDIPASASLVPVDFETDSLAARLASSGFRRTEPAVFIWLGVIFYLTLPAIEATLEYIADQGAPSTVVFDYLRPAQTDEEKAQLTERTERLATLGEPWLTYFTPDDIAVQLREFGFGDIDDYSATQLVDHYVGDVSQPASKSPNALSIIRILSATNTLEKNSAFH